MTKIDKETKRLKRKRYQYARWTFLCTFLVSLILGTGFLASILSAMLFATIARMTVSEELENHYKMVYPGRIKKCP